MKFITHNNLLAWLGKLKEERTLIAPQDVGKGHIHYRPVSDMDAITFDYTRPDMSAKEFLFPQTERLMRIEKRGDEVTLHDYFLEEKQVIFGLRPCDAHGFLAFDALFLEQDPPDTYYARRREMTTLVGLSCPEMWENCFCGSVGGGPDDPSHVDVLLTALGDGYAVQVTTPKGEALLASANVQEKPDLALPEIPQNDPIPILPTGEWPALFDNQYWARLGERCLSCKLCTYVCPACRCFDLRDEEVLSGAGLVIHDRMRVWDACTAPNYRTIAGGHNSRAVKGQRIRNRYYCKFYYYPEDFGPLGCVGCGRCIEACPVNIDIAEMLVAVSDMSQGQEVSA